MKEPQIFKDLKILESKIELIQKVLPKEKDLIIAIHRIQDYFYED